MQVILLENIKKLGKLGDLVSVKTGFARNYLIPKHKAVFATKDNLAKFEERKAYYTEQENKKLAEATQRQEQFVDLEFTIAARASEEGKLYGSVGVREIVKAAQEKNIALEASEVSIPVGVIRDTGDYEVVIHLHAEVELTVPVKVVAE